MAFSALFSWGAIGGWGAAFVRSHHHFYVVYIERERARTTVRARQHTWRATARVHMCAACGEDAVLVHGRVSAVIEEIWRVRMYKTHVHKTFRQCGT